MEAIGVGANVLAFVVLGIKSAKLAHDTLSAISDGPARVRNLAADFLQLHWILEQLLECRAAETDTALHGQARQCCETLGKLAKTIERLQVSPGERVTGRFWKRLKAAISESDLEKLGPWVAQQTSMLSLRLNVLSSNAIYETRDNIQSVAQSITSSHNEGKSAIEAGFSPFQETIKGIHYISSKDTRAMLPLLKYLNSRIVPESEDGTEMTNLGGDDEHAMDEAAPGSDQKLLGSIDSLCSLSNEKNIAVDPYGEDNDQAKSAIQDLQELVQNLRRRKNHEVSDPKSFDDDLGQFGEWFRSGTLSINSGVESSRMPFTRVTRSFREVDIGAGKIHFMVQKRKRAIDTTDQDDDDPRAKKRCHSDWMMMKLAFVPGRGQNNHMLLASLIRQRLSKSMAYISQLQINRVLPLGSLVFELVRIGDLEGLKEMLQDGEASLRDHDEHGASLLFYSITQPEVCKFLIDSGLDVDHVGGRPRLPEFLVPALKAHGRIDSETEPEELRRVIECRRLLLRAGADPTLTVYDDYTSNNLLDDVINDNVAEVAELAWNPEFVSPFADIKTYRTKRGLSPLLGACESRANRYNRQCFHQLLKLGANIEDRDEHGRTCLHLCIQNLLPLNRYADLREFEAIQYLVQKGADPRAVDKSGRSVSEIAYTKCMIWGINCSYPGDLWDAVLHSCGYNIVQFRSGYRRRAIYTTLAHNRTSSVQYSRRTFERFWGERWKECPYWDDKPWPPLGPAEADSDDEFRDHECTCDDCLGNYSDGGDDESESGSELDTEENEEETSLDDGSIEGCPHHFYVDQDEEQSESDKGHVESYWEETGTLPGFGELMQGMPSENWQDSPDLGRSTVGTPRSLSMDLENPWL